MRRRVSGGREWMVVTISRELWAVAVSRGQTMLSGIRTTRLTLVRGATRGMWLKVKGKWGQVLLLPRSESRCGPVSRCKLTQNTMAAIPQLQPSFQRRYGIASTSGSNANDPRLYLSSWAIKYEPSRYYCYLQSVPPTITPLTSSYPFPFLASDLLSTFELFPFLSPATRKSTLDCISISEMSSLFPSSTLFSNPMAREKFTIDTYVLHLALSPCRTPCSRSLPTVSLVSSTAPPAQHQERPSSLSTPSTRRVPSPARPSSSSTTSSRSSGSATSSPSSSPRRSTAASPASSSTTAGRPTRPSGPGSRVREMSS